METATVIALAIVASTVFLVLSLLRTLLVFVTNRKLNRIEESMYALGNKVSGVVQDVEGLPEPPSVETKKIKEQKEQQVFAKKKEEKRLKLLKELEKLDEK